MIVRYRKNDAIYIDVQNKKYSKRDGQKSLGLNGCLHIVKLYFFDRDRINKLNTL